MNIWILCYFLCTESNQRNFIMEFLLVGPSGLEPPTSCLSGTRSNLLSYEPMWLVSDFSSLGITANTYSLFTITFYFSCGKLFASHADVGIELSSRTVSRKVFSPLQSLTSVFGMGTGGPSALRKPTSLFDIGLRKLNNKISLRIRQTALCRDCTGRSP